MYLYPYLQGYYSDACPRMWSVGLRLLGEKLSVNFKVKIFYPAVCYSKEYSDVFSLSFCQNVLYTVSCFPFRISEQRHMLMLHRRLHSIRRSLKVTALDKLSHSLLNNTNKADKWKLSLFFRYLKKCSRESTQLYSIKMYMSKLNVDS